MTNNEQYKKIADDILKDIGGSENIASATHCMTRLRFNLKDESIPNDEKVRDIPGVVGVNRAGGQYQVIIGQTVDKVYDQIVKDGNLTTAPIVDENLDDPAVKEPFSWKKLGTTILNKLAGSLTPLIPILIAASMFKMFAAILGPTMLNIVSANSDIYRLLALVGNAGFYFFPIFLGYTASKQFGVGPMIPMFLGAIMIDPNMTAIVKAGKAFSVFGIPMTLVDYGNSVIPIILSVWLLSYVEKFFKKIIPSSLSTIFVPTLSVLVMLPVTLTIVGPAGTFLSKYITDGILAIGKMGGIWAILGIALIAAFWQILVMTGMHLIMISTMVLIFAQTGHDSFIDIGAITSSLSVAGMCLGATLWLKNKDEKSLALSYLIASFVGGVTEPGLYGLAIRYKRPFIGMMVGGFVGGLYAGITHVTAFVLVPVANFLALTGYVGGTVNNLVNGIIAAAIAFVVAAVVTYVVGVKEDSEAIQTSNKPLKLEVVM